MFLLTRLYTKVKKFRIKVITSNKINKNIIKATLKITPNILQVYRIKPQTYVHQTHPNNEENFIANIIYRLRLKTSFG